jgi:hypothetical protein
VADTTRLTRLLAVILPAILASAAAPADPAPPADDSPGLNAAIAAGNVTVRLEPRTYALGAPLNGTVPGVSLVGVPGTTRLVPAAAAHGITALDNGQTYRGWAFEGIEFDGNLRALAAAGGPRPPTLPIDGSSGVRFRRCRFRDLLAVVRDSADVRFEDCDFYGTRPGLFAAGVQDPPAVPTATLSDGLAIAQSSRDVRVSGCRFHFCNNGLAVAVQAGQSASGLVVSGCSFRGDWWDSPAPILRFRAADVTRGPDGVWAITSPAGGLRAAFSAGQVVSFRRDLGDGPRFTRVYAGQVQAETRAFAGAAAGDMIETADGRRARITSIESPSSANVEGWEDTATYEPTDPPALTTPWRLARDYACGSFGVVSDTQVRLYFEPVNPFTGERAISDARLDLTKLPARALAKATYSGLHVNAGVSGLLVSGCTFRGAWADQCSLFDLPEGARILGNRFLHGQDEAVTLTRCPGSIVADNVFLNCGVSAVDVGQGDGCVIRGNTVRNWGVVNPNPGAVSGSGRGLIVQANTFLRTPSPARDWCRMAVSLTADSTGTVVAGNVDAGATRAAVYVAAEAAPARGAITVRDARSVAGPGAGNVSVK